MTRKTAIPVIGLLIMATIQGGFGEILAGRQSEDSEWVDAMRKVHARFDGRPGTFAHFGDSISVTLAYWTPMLYQRKNASEEMEQSFQLVRNYMAEECWREWKGPKYGNEGGMTVRWAYENVDGWLRDLNPEVALIMFGTNDLNSVPLEEYESKLRIVVSKCLSNGTVVILSTIPPRHGFAEKAARYADATRRVAREARLPLVDYHAEMLKRRPDDWDGALPAFEQFSGYDVPTLIARDGVHPSHPKTYQDDYSEEALGKSGFSLRNYLALMRYAEVLRALEIGPTPSPPEPEKSKTSEEWAIDPPIQPWFPKAPPPPHPQGATVEVSTVNGLFKAVAEAKPGQTILLADGHYLMPRYLTIRTDNVTLRGKSGRRERVVLDGIESSRGELMGVFDCSGVTIAHLTIQNIKWNGFKLNTDTNVQNVTIYDCIIHNIWQRGIKGVAVPAKNRERTRPRNFRIQYCLFYNDRPKRFSDDPTDTPENFDGNYIGGIDAMYATNWTISDNVFVGIRGRTGEARGAVFLWHDARDCVVERNIIIDGDTGICLGNSHRGPETNIHATRCVVRNNFVTRCAENGILADYTRDCSIAHNTVHDPESRLRRLIRLVHDNDGLVVANNLLSGPPPRIESSSRMVLRDNLQGDFTSLFRNAKRGDLHLTPNAASAIDNAEPVSEVTEDIDGQSRRNQSTVGADEAPRE